MEARKFGDVAIGDHFFYNKKFLMKISNVMKVEASGGTVYNCVSINNCGGNKRGELESVESGSICEVLAT